MKPIKNALRILLFGIALILFTFNSYSQTKKIKRPKSNVAISSVDQLIRESFDIYDKVYKYDGHAEADTPLDDSDIDILEDALDDLQGLSDNASNILSDFDGISVLKHDKAQNRRVEFIKI